MLPAISESIGGLSGAGAHQGARPDADFRPEPGSARAPSGRPATSSPRATLSTGLPGISRAVGIPLPTRPNVAAIGEPAPTGRVRLRLLDYIVPHEMRMGRTPHVDIDGVRQHPSGRISETETVWTALQVLCAAQQAPVPPEGDRPVSAYFNIEVEAVGNPIFPVPVQYAGYSQEHATSAKAGLEAELTILERSATFRQLIRSAVHAGRLGLETDRRWTVRIVPPMGFCDGLAVFSAAFLPDSERRTLLVPSLQSPLIAGRYYLAEQGGVTPVGSSCSTIQAIIATLTGTTPPAHAAWLDRLGGIDPRRICELGAGERGAVGYLTQRVVRELFSVGVPWLSSLPFADANLGSKPDPIGGLTPLNVETRQALNAIGGVAGVKRYVEWQDHYIEACYPLAVSKPVPAPRGTPAAGR